MTQGVIKLDQQFVNFAKYGDSAKIDGKTIMLSQIDKWFIQANIIDRKLTLTDTGLTFSKFKTRAIPYQDFLKFLEDLAEQKDIPMEQLKEKLQTCGVPGTGKGKGKDGKAVTK